MKKLLIIGAGAAGMAAAVTAAQAGASVTVLERSASPGGNGRFAEGVFGAGSALQRRLNIDASAEALFREAMEFSHWRSDARLTRTLIDASGETVDWLMALGVPFCRVIHHMVNQSPEVFHMTAEGPSGKYVMQTLLERAGGLGVEIVTEARVRSLLVENGRVCGAETESGVRYEADGVLLATGGMAGDPALIHELLPSFEADKFLHGRGIHHPGDGVKLARQVGAEPVRDLAIEGAGPVFCGHGPVGALVRSAQSIWVNILGERFCDEAIVDDFVFGQNAVARQPEKRCFAVFDDALVQRLMDSAPGVMAPIDAADNGFAMLREALDKAVADGLVFRADSVEALAEAAGLDMTALADTVAAYNHDCARGEDCVFSKPRRCLFALDRAPYYAAKAGMDMITVHGGVRTDSRMRVLNAAWQPIEGLWCAGIDVSGVDSGDYSVMLSGHAFGFSLAGGRLAARDMLK